MYCTIDSTKTYPSTTVFEALFEQETDVPGDYKLFIDTDKPENNLTRDSLKRDILLFAQGLKDKYSFGPGDIMAVCAPNHLDWAIAVHAPPVIGAITASVRAIEGPENVIKDIMLVRPKIIIAHKETLETVKVAANAINLEYSRILIFGDETVDGFAPFRSVLMNHSTLATQVKLTLDELSTKPAYLYFTSGTTGTRKAVIITHDNVVITFCAKQIWLTYETRYLSYTNNAHASALIVAMSNCVKNGVQTYLLKDFTLQRLCEAIQQYKIQVFATQPWVSAALTRERFVSNYDLSSLEYAISAGSPLDPMTMIRFKNRHDATLCSFFGMTESLLIFQVSQEGARRGIPGSIGTLYPEFTVKLVGDNGKEVPHGSIGELCIKGRFVTTGYYKNAEATAAAIDKDGFYHCGDLVRVDDEGYFYYISRIKDIIKYYAYHISPPEIEYILLSHPGVSECCVVGDYSEELSTELPKAFVVLSMKSKYLSIDNLQEYANDRLPDYMRLRGGLVILNELPKSSLGKILRSTLRHQMGQPIKAIETKTNCVSKKPSILTMGQSTIA
ncbi:hypothetical protein J3Q64DRAFT_1694450 [Phycomyces blakesleeanus]|uniref:AMP-dependent synthetase/ligase domain-containing protein n=2 Tax=Phycomyces blakesleeanus TaxID=4837 RepID=A0A167QLY2_PHYB8|nr:hypothetical protein PHYBLDRAFT_58942 [Phycomyces blakesleeanus NRRL 1555(-)]OAD79899.1 hypothetical protein PHYBLDRAFT_58942 [Phycomyces blakesleeanus NRRL 1555(-)]|eukprot:XP_018297939.1 hypothetical protein PHYBLDRAFT_58942 [Phycomyces blakesleeanus NRRL 1555(-)]